MVRNIEYHKKMILFFLEWRIQIIRSYQPISHKNMSLNQDYYGDAEHIERLEAAEVADPMFGAEHLPEHHHMGHPLQRVNAGRLSDIPEDGHYERPKPNFDNMQEVPDSKAVSIMPGTPNKHDPNPWNIVYHKAIDGHPAGTRSRIDADQREVRSSINRYYGGSDDKSPQDLFGRV